MRKGFSQESQAKYSDWRYSVRFYHYIISIIPLTPALSQREREECLPFTPALSQREREECLPFTPVLSQWERGS
jgi:hypothetical protein